MPSGCRSRRLRCQGTSAVVRGRLGRFWQALKKLKGWKEGVVRKEEKSFWRRWRARLETYVLISLEFKYGLKHQHMTRRSFHIYESMLINWGPQLEAHKVESRREEFGSFASQCFSITYELSSFRTWHHFNQLLQIPKYIVVFILRTNYVTDSKIPKPPLLNRNLSFFIILPSALRQVRFFRPVSISLPSTALTEGPEVRRLELDEKVLELRRGDRVALVGPSGIGKLRNGLVQYVFFLECGML